MNLQILCNLLILFKDCAVIFFTDFQGMLFPSFSHYGIHLISICNMCNKNKTLFFKLKIATFQWPKNCFSYAIDWYYCSHLQTPTSPCNSLLQSHYPQLRSHELLITATTFSVDFNSPRINTVESHIGKCTEIHVHNSFYGRN